MRRIETYVGVQVYEWFFSAQAQYNMIGLAKLSSALLGAGPIARGLACGPTSPATMTVQIAKGEIYQQADLEATACGTLPADTTDQILKQGIQLGTFTSATFAAPTSSGQSINYLLECQYQDEDISLDPTTGNSPVVELFYNADNPQVPWSGPNDSGATSNTFRDGVVAWQVKAGVAATTGSQVTPTPDSGWTGLWVVTVPFGATSLSSSNISQYPGSPLLPYDILPSIVNGALRYGIDNGASNAVQASFPLPSATLTDNQSFWVKIKSANTGATTFTPNPGVVSASPVVGLAGSALQGGELPANGRALFIWRADITSYVLTFCAGGALQVGTATASTHAVQFGQIVGLIGQSTDALIDNHAAASASVTYNATQLVVGSAVGGLLYYLSGISSTFATTAANGIGGMDTGAAPASGFIALYEMYNPTTGAKGLMGQTVSAAPARTYTGAHAPSGYTASALVGIVPTTAAAIIGICAVEGDLVKIVSATVATTAVTIGWTTIPLATWVPPGAKGVIGNMTAQGVSVVNAFVQLSSYSNGLAFQECLLSGPNITSPGAGSTVPFGNLAIITSQTMYYSSGASSGTSVQGTVAVTGYRF